LVGNGVVVAVDGNSGSGVMTVDGASGFVRAGSLTAVLLSLLGGVEGRVGLLGLHLLLLLSTPLSPPPSTLPFLSSF